MGSIFLDSENRSASAALFVQDSSMPISRQDLESAVYQRGYGRSDRGSNRTARRRGFWSREPFRWDKNTVSPWATPKSRLACSLHHTALKIEDEKVGSLIAQLRYFQGNRQKS